MDWQRTAAIAMIAGACCAGPAMAQDFSSFVDEVRIGGQFHDAYPGFIPTTPSKFRFNQLEDVSLDVLFRSPDIDAFRWLGSPRPNLGGTLSLTGQESMIHLGLTWHVPIFELPIFIEGTFGGALNNGYASNPPPGFRALGCNLMFYEQAGIGANIGDNVTATVTYEHTSNAGLCNPNAGLSNVGLRLGWKF